MPDPSFPTLSVDLEMDDWEEELAGDPTMRTTFEAGYTQTYGRFTRTPNKYPCSLKLLTDAEKQTLKRFEKERNVGAGAFYIPNLQEAYGAAIWVKATTYVLDQVVTPVTKTGRSYKCIVAGTSHASTEPTWPTTINITVADNTVTWQENTMHVRLSTPIKFSSVGIPGYWNAQFEIEEL